MKTTQNLVKNVKIFTRIISNMKKVQKNMKIFKNIIRIVKVITKIIKNIVKIDQKS